MDSRNFTYMFYGFAVAWLIPAIYLITLMLREKRLQSELDRVKRMIGDRDSSVASSGGAATRKS